MQTTEIRVQANGVELAAKQWGSPDAPAIIAVHGWLDNAASFDRLAPFLEGFRFISLDLAGHGYSAHRAEGVRYHLLDNVDDVIALADALSLERFILLAHSMGAGIATCVAGAFPERIGKLILIEGIGAYTRPPAEAPAQLRQAVEDMKQASAKRKPVYESRDDAIRARAQVFSGLSTDAAALICSRGLEGVNGGYSWRADSRLRMAPITFHTNDLVAAYLRNLSMPVLVIRARNSVLANDPTLQREAETIPSCRSVLLEGNHHLHLERDTVGSVALALQSFLAP